MRADTETRAKLWDMIHGIRFAMLTSRSIEGQLRSRPLTTQNRSLDDDESLWFFVSRSSETAADVGCDAAVNLAYADTDNDRYVSIAGSATLVEDPSRNEALWSIPAKAWFPGGPTDPNLQLVGVRIEHAEYWDVKTSKMVQLFKMAKAAATGEPPQIGEHGKVN